MAKTISAALKKRIEQVKAKRARVVLDTIVEQGAINTDELKALGYNHAPRAAADVREQGIQLKTTMIKTSQGKRMASYSFAAKPLELSKVGRAQIPKATRTKLIERSGGKCDICTAMHNLQIDHRIPYAITGEAKDEDANPFQVLCGSCNRTKSWDCEHCENMTLRNPENCRQCYWANQTNYTHVRMKLERRVDLVWSANELAEFEELRGEALRKGCTVAEEIKARVNQKSMA